MQKEVIRVGGIRGAAGTAQGVQPEFLLGLHAAFLPQVSVNIPELGKVAFKQDDGVAGNPGLAVGLPGFALQPG